MAGFTRVVVGWSLLLLAAALHAEGGPGQGVLHVPSDYPTVQAALDAATDGDEVVLADGTYTGPGNWDLDFGGKAVVLRSGSGNPFRCVLDGGGGASGPHRLLDFDDGEPPETRVEAITIWRGFAPEVGGTASAGGVRCINGSTPTFVNCVILENSAHGETTGTSAGIAAGGSTLIDCVISNNSARSNLGLSTGPAVTGGGMLIGCTISGNSPGGGLSFSGTMIDCVVSDNTASGSSFFCSGDSGGGLVATGATCINCVFTGNRALSPTCAGNQFETYGGAVSGSGTFVGCSFIGNLARGWGGGGGAVSAVSGPVTLIDCLFEDNEATGINAGGALHVRSATVAVNCVFRENSTWTTGGAVYVESGSLDLANCLLAANATLGLDGAAGPGGAIRVAGGSATVVNCTVVANEADTGTGGIDGDAGTTTIRNSIVRGNVAGQLAGVTDVAYSNVEGGAAGAGNIDRPPLFVDLAGGDVRLLPGSPCIDAGDNAAVPPDDHDLDDDRDTTEPLPLDLAGNPRFVDDPRAPDTGAGPSPIVDMGAYESVPCAGDTNGDHTVNVTDLVAVITDWGCADPPGPCPGDVNGDGTVDVLDLLDVILGWGACSP